MQTLLYKILFCTKKISHIESQTFSAVSGFNFSNDIFSSSFENYYLTMVASNTDTATMTIRFRTAGVDNSTSNYGRLGLFTSAGSVSASTATGQSFLPLMHSVSTAMSFAFQGTFYSPFETKFTAVDSTWLSQIGNDASRFRITSHGGFVLTTSFDSISFNITSGTMTGLASVYGLAK